MSELLAHRGTAEARKPIPRESATRAHEPLTLAGTLDPEIVHLAKELGIGEQLVKDVMSKRTQVANAGVQLKIPEPAGIYAEPMQRGVSPLPCTQTVRDAEVRSSGSSSSDAQVIRIESADVSPVSKAISTVKPVQTHESTGSVEKETALAIAAPLSPFINPADQSYNRKDWRTLTAILSSAEEIQYLRATGHHSRAGELKSKVLAEMESFKDTLAAKGVDVPRWFASHVSLIREDKALPYAPKVAPTEDDASKNMKVTIDAISKRVENIRKTALEGRVSKITSQEILIEQVWDLKREVHSLLVDKTIEKLFDYVKATGAIILCSPPWPKSSRTPIDDNGVPIVTLSISPPGGGNDRAFALTPRGIRVVQTYDGRTVTLRGTYDEHAPAWRTTFVTNRLTCIYFADAIRAGMTLEGAREALHLAAEAIAEGDASKDPRHLAIDINRKYYDRIGVLPRLPHLVAEGNALRGRK